MHKYKTIKKLGEGSYGKVFLVEEIDNGDINSVLRGISHQERISKKNKKYYVLKKIDLKKLSKKEKEFSFQELELLKYLKHPFMIRYKDAFLKNKVLYLIMNFCACGDLENFIKKNYNNPSRNSNNSKRYYNSKEIFFLFYQLLLSLNYLHHQNIIHRDIKTQNIFLKSRLSIQLGDFGICKIVEKNKNFLTNTLIGTPFSMSPEQIINSEKYSFKSDCWSVGIILFELLFKRNPIEIFYKSRCNSINNLLNEIKNKRRRMILFNSSTYKNNRYIRQNKYFTFFLKKLCQKNKKKRWNTFDCLNYVFTKKFFKLNLSFFYNKELVEGNDFNMYDGGDDGSPTNLNFTINQKKMNFKNLKFQLIKLSLYFRQRKQEQEEQQEEEEEIKKRNPIDHHQKRKEKKSSDEIYGRINYINQKNEQLNEKLKRLKMIEEEMILKKKKEEKKNKIIPVVSPELIISHSVPRKKPNNNDFDYLQKHLPKKKKYISRNENNNKPRSLPNNNNNNNNRFPKKRIIRKKRKKSVPLHHQRQPVVVGMRKKKKGVIRKKKRKKKYGFEKQIQQKQPKLEDQGRIIKEDQYSDDDDSEEEGKVIMVEDSVTAGFSSSESSSEDSDDDDDDDDDDSEEDNNNNNNDQSSSSSSSTTTTKVFGSLQKRFLMQKKNCIDIFGDELFEKIYGLYKTPTTSINTASNIFKKIKEMLEGKGYLLEFVCLIEELCFIEKSL